MNGFPILCLGAAATLGLMAGMMPFGASKADALQVKSELVDAAVMEQGEALYRKNCRFCHGTKGTSGKRLAGNEMVADAGYVAHVILVGPGYMTAFAEHLSDQEIAMITTYVRNSWGNSYGPMDSSAVAALR